RMQTTAMAVFSGRRIGNPVASCAGGLRRWARKGDPSRRLGGVGADQEVARLENGPERDQGSCQADPRIGEENLDVASYEDPRDAQCDTHANGPPVSNAPNVPHHPWNSEQESIIEERVEVCCQGEENGERDDPGTVVRRSRASAVYGDPGEHGEGRS